MVDFKIWCNNKNEIETVANILDKLGVVGLVSGVTPKQLMKLDCDEIGVLVRNDKLSYTISPETFDDYDDLVELALTPKQGKDKELTINEFCATANAMGYHARIEVRDGDDAVVFSNSDDADLFYLDWDTGEIFLTWSVDDMGFVIIDGYTAQRAVKVVVNEVKNVLKGIVEYYELGDDNVIS